MISKDKAIDIQICGILFAIVGGILAIVIGSILNLDKTTWSELIITMVGIGFVIWLVAFIIEPNNTSRNKSHGDKHE